jgi:hypothetical protein
MPTRRGFPFFIRLMPLSGCMPSSEKKVHAIQSPAHTASLELLSKVTIPPIAMVKYSSVDGPTPSSIGRTDLLRQTPAKKYWSSMILGWHAAHTITGDAVSAAT